MHEQKIEQIPREEGLDYTWPKPQVGNVVKLQAKWRARLHTAQWRRYILKLRRKSCFQKHRILIVEPNLVAREGNYTQVGSWGQRDRCNSSIRGLPIRIFRKFKCAADDFQECWKWVLVRQELTPQTAKSTQIKAFQLYTIRLTKSTNTKHQPFQEEMAT